jgi:hypothetical protein
MHEIRGSGGDDKFEVKAGDRMPYFEVDGESVYDQLRAPKFHLITFSNGETGDVPPVLNDPAEDRWQRESELDGIRSYALLVDRYVLRLSPPVVKIFGTDKPFNLLLRPDNYIGFISSDTSSGPLLKYFALLFNGDSI